MVNPFKFPWEKEEMAKKTPAKVNKSGAIRDYVTKNPDAKPKAVAEALTAKKIEVTPALVSIVKNKMGAKKPKAKKAAKATGTTSLTTLLDAAKQCGGLDNAISIFLNP
jgi:hypothetical protein